MIVNLLITSFVSKFSNQIKLIDTSYNFTKQTAHSYLLGTDNKYSSNKKESIEYRTPLMI